MSLEYFYITNDPKIAAASERAGVDRIFIDMEYIGKDERQGGLDTVKNHHTLTDIKRVKKVLKRAKLLVRVNPIHSESKKEIEGALKAGADYIMLPMWKSAEEAQSFLQIVNGRAKTMLLLETDEARKCLDEVLELKGIDEIHIGLNDLHLSQQKKFMFELLVDGTVDEIAAKLKAANMKFGIGGVGRVKSNYQLPAENIFCEHYRLGSSMVILSRVICDWTKISSVSDFETQMSQNISNNREFENQLKKKDKAYFEIMHKQTAEIIKRIHAAK